MSPMLLPEFNTRLVFGKYTLSLSLIYTILYFIVGIHMYIYKDKYEPGAGGSRL
jgi:hypothetical protein